jgi:hypothetical protein
MSPILFWVSRLLMPRLLGSIAVVGLALFGSAEVATHAAESDATVTATTADGREFTGVIDARTDGKTLWLRRDGAGFTLAQSLQWNEIASARLGAQPLDPFALRIHHRELVSPASGLFVGEIENAPPQAQPTPLVNEIAAQAAAGRPPRVRSVEITSASLVNLDRDVEPDGIAVAVSPISAHGTPTPVRGVLRATLVAQRRDMHTGEVQFGELNRWSQTVRPEDFVDGVATYDLPFRATAPEWDFQLEPDALITVQLSAAGHGSFAASAPIALRQFNPMRDQMQLFRGSRFAPAEVHGTQPLAPFGAQQGLWQFWAR